MLKSLTLLVVQSSQMLLENTGVLSVQHQCTILIAPEHASSGRIFFFFFIFFGWKRTNYSFKHPQLPMQWQNLASSWDPNTTVCYHILLYWLNSRPCCYLLSGIEKISSGQCLVYFSCFLHAVLAHLVLKLHGNTIFTHLFLSCGNHSGAPSNEYENSPVF